MQCSPDLKLIIDRENYYKSPKAIEPVTLFIGWKRSRKMSNQGVQCNTLKHGMEMG